MKCLKVDDYVRRTASLKETCLLLDELEDYLKKGPGLQGRTLGDRIIRACNQQLDVGPPPLDHIGQLLKLVEVALCCYDVSGEHVAQTTPLYMEKIIFHIVKKLSSLRVYTLSCHLGRLLYGRLDRQQQTEDLNVLARCCFAVLWKGPSVAKDETTLHPRDKLHSQMQSLMFLLLMDRDNTVPLSSPKAPVYAEDAFTMFQKGCGTLTKEDASFVLQETLTVFHTCWHTGADGSGDQPYLPALCVVLTTAKLLCKAGYCDLASSLIDEAEGNFRHCDNYRGTALLLGRWAVNIYCSKNIETGQVLTECARALRSLPSTLGHQDTHAVLEGCSLVVWAVEGTRCKRMSGSVLLAWFSFLEEHQELIMKRLQKKMASQTEENGLQQSLCFSMYHGFWFAYESMLASMLENSETLERVLLYCQATAARMMIELRKLSTDDTFINAVTAVSNLVCGLYNRRFYDQAFILVEILCQELRKKCPASLSMDRFSRPFMLAVQSSRRGGHLERALDWIILWLKALGPNILSHMAGPISLWVKTKADAARTNEEGIQLRTIQDGFGSDCPDESVILRLLEEELRAYKELTGDTSQERYNTLCDLLEICHEESSHTHLRAVYLCEMAQVVCFQDFSEQTDCMAVDFIHEALRLLEEEPETADNVDRLKDDQAHALLWLYICTLEKTLQEAIDKEKRLQDVREQPQSLVTPIGTNDLDYEDKLKTQDSTAVYEGLHFNLAAQNKFCQPLERAMAIWSSLLQHQDLPSVRNPKQTCSSIVLTAALFKLMGKSLRALEAYQQALGLARHLADPQGCANSLCQSAMLLLDLGSPELAEDQLGQAEQFLAKDTTAEGPSPLAMLAILLKAQCCYSTGQVVDGVPYLCEVLKEVNEPRQSKSWYLLRARALQTCSSYLSLDTAELPQDLRQCVTQHGFTNPHTALYESLKLFSSLLVTLVGKGIFGTSSSSADMRFIDQGDNLVVKWQLLSELLGCSLKMVAARSRTGAVHDAKLQCLEALKLATKLKAVSQCAELLVVKAELELMKGEREESGFDLDSVRNLLELSTDFSNNEQKATVKIKPRKGRPAPKCPSPLPCLEDDCSGLLRTRRFPKEAVDTDQCSSPPLKVPPRSWLASLGHDGDCQCRCCSEPSLGHVTARWASVKAALVLLLDPTEAKAFRQLHKATLARCRSVTAKLATKLAKLFPHAGPGKTPPEPSLMDNVVGDAYLRMVLAGLEPRHEKIHGLWDILNAGLAFVSSKPSLELRPLRAGFLAAKAVASLLALAAKRTCAPEELFSDAWMWNPCKDMQVLKVKPKKPLQDSLQNAVVKDPSVTSKTKAPRGKVAAPKIKVTSSSSSSGRSLFPMTPIMFKPTQARQPAGDLSSFDFVIEEPTVACTPVHRVRAPPRVKKGLSKATPTPQFHIYEELSPVQAPPTPAAPKRLRKSRFKVEFSDESDTEANLQAERNVKTETVKRAPAARSIRKSRTAPEPPAHEAPPKTQSRRKKSTALPASASSGDDGDAGPQPAPARRGRGRRMLKETMNEEPEKMRAIEEEQSGTLDSSIECLRTSDAEIDENAASNTEVLRRDLCGDLERVTLSKLRSRGHVIGLQDPLSTSDTWPDTLSLEAIQSLLRCSWLALHHSPPSALYPSLCGLLALTLGQQDPVTTAMLHTQSLGVTNRHNMIRHLSSQLKNLKKTSNALADKMATLTLDELSAKSETRLKHRFLELENLFSFTATNPDTFPQNHSKEFMQQLQDLPSGVTVCVLSVVGIKPGETGDTILLSRLERGSPPVTVHIPTSHLPDPVGRLVQEMDCIQAEQKVVSSIAEKAKWWEGRRALDSRVERLLEKMEGLLGCWKSCLLPLTSDPELSTQAKRLHEALSAQGLDASEEVLKVVLSGSPLLSKEELRMFALGVSQWGKKGDELLQTAVSYLAKREEPKGHLVLILDKHLQRLPWESIPCLKPCSVTRMPSLHSLLGHCLQKRSEPQGILTQGVDSKKVFYVLDPDANLGDTQECFKEWFSGKRDWQGVCGVAPDSEKLQEAVATKDLYIYVGHGAGARFLDGQKVLKQEMRAASLLFGCSSAALAVRGDLEGAGIILNYLMAGCPLVLGNLWDVTDRDIDRFTKALLESWLSAGAGASLLDHMGASRQATHLKHLIGAAPVVYGLPIHLQ